MHPATPPLAFLAGGPGAFELLVVFAVVLIVFGPQKLPEIARRIASFLHQMRNASDDFRRQILLQDAPPEPPPPPRPGVTPPSGTTRPRSPAAPAAPPPADTAATPDAAAPPPGPDA